MESINNKIKNSISKKRKGSIISCRREFVIRAADRDASSGFIKTGSTDCKSAPADIVNKNA
jgi:hypothetical protein